MGYSEHHDKLWIAVITAPGELVVGTQALVSIYLGAPQDVGKNPVVPHDQDSAINLENGQNVVGVTTHATHA
jgi:hypothetical protein